MSGFFDTSIIKDKNYGMEAVQRFEKDRRMLSTLALVFHPFAALAERRRVRERLSEVIAQRSHKKMEREREHEEEVFLSAFHVTSLTDLLSLADAMECVQLSASLAQKKFLIMDFSSIPKNADLPWYALTELLDLQIYVKRKNKKIKFVGLPDEFLVCMKKADFVQFDVYDNILSAIDSERGKQ